jgi:hypothetical protein
MLSISLVINSSSLSLSNNYKLISSGSIILFAQNIVLNDVFLSASSLWIDSPIINLMNATILSESGFGSDCSCSAKTSCVPPNYYFPYLYNSVRYLSSFNYSLMNYTV